MKIIRTSTGLAAISVITSLRGGGGPPLTHWHTGGWRPTYIAIHTQCSEPWADFFEVLQLLIWWRDQRTLFPG